ncbi:hypothetical protein BD410DRAFT_841490 [Rickenella mellea]|uniref:Novel STAND NTPase 1 domain-containing protein n=1 Tax=Rickenella mellea TaxID=50990 RepID=A0A4Y7PYG4_9AGAM|nr:hypothetical protein BD410DRAFT_841490 [Rickenella mellea]
MSFVQAEHIPSGVYAIRNYRTMNVIATRSRDKDLLGSIPSAERSWKWNVTRRSNNKYTVQNDNDQFYAQCAPTPEAGKTVFVQSQVFEWNIKQVSEVTARDCYWIYSSKNDRLVWSLPDGEDGTPVVFAVERNNPRFWWRFERIEDASSGQEATARLDYLPDYIRAVGLIDMARDLMARSQYLEALKGCDEAVRLHRAVIAKQPDLETSNMDLAFSLQILADCLCRLGMLDKALDAIEDAIRVYQTKTVAYHEESPVTDAIKIKEKIADRIAQQSLKTDQKAILRMVEDIQCQITNINLTKDETPVEFNAEAPPPPEIFFGRDEYVANVVDMILKKMPARLAILGPGGVGKTAVASAVYHHEQIEAFFQDHRFFITCEAMFSAESLLDTLWVVFGLDVKKQKSLKVLGDRIKAGPYTLLILDNFETLWDVMIDKMEIQKLFGMLTSNIMKKLTVLITMRGTMRPANIVWTRPFLEPLPVLSVEAAKDLYLAVADSNEEGLDALLETVDCLPLAVNLLANLSQQGYSPLELLDMWNKERTHLLNIGGNDKSENIEVSIALSINSPLMSNNEEALILLKLAIF